MAASSILSTAMVSTVRAVNFQALRRPWIAWYTPNSVAEAIWSFFAGATGSRLLSDSDSWLLSRLLPGSNSVFVYEMPFDSSRGKHRPNRHQPEEKCGAHNRVHNRRRVHPADVPSPYSGVIEAEPQHCTSVQSVPPIEHEPWRKHSTGYRSPVRPHDVPPLCEQYQRVNANGRLLGRLRESDIWREQFAGRGSCLGIVCPDLRPSFHKLPDQIQGWRLPDVVGPGLKESPKTPICSPSRQPWNLVLRVSSGSRRWRLLTDATAPSRTGSSPADLARCLSAPAWIR